MKYSFFLLIILVLISCESEKIPYRCGVPNETDGATRDVSMDILDVGDILYFDGNKFMANADLSEVDDSDVSLKDIVKTDGGITDISGGRSCTNIGVSAECSSDESCYPFVECGGLCRKCGSSTSGSNCEIHSDCKCGMVCLSLTDKSLKCYKVCKSNSDCPSGQSCTDGWGIEYEHEYYKICKGIATKTEEGK